MKKLKGTGASRGIAIGTLYHFRHVKHREIPYMAYSPQEECRRFETARASAVHMLRDVYRDACTKVGPEESMIFEIHRILLEDPDYVQRVTQLIEEQLCCAEYAVESVGLQLSEIFARMDNLYMRERSADIKDITNRVLNVLYDDVSVDFSQMENQAILAAADLLPSETIQMDHSKVLAVVTSAGSKISHSAILARTLGIPAVVGLGTQLSTVSHGDFVIVDGFSGELYVNPDEDLVEYYQNKYEEHARYKHRLRQLKGRENKTLDGVQVKIFANVGNVSDILQVMENDGQGIGLFRSEFLYMDSTELPTEQEQFEVYRSILLQMDGKRTVIRTLDTGAEKTLPYLNIKPEQNPVLGIRGIRFCLLHPDIFKIQLRALLRASVYGHLAIMVPMIVSAEEFLEAKKLLELCMAELDEEGFSYDARIQVGAMIETPSAALISGQLAQYADFFSIGTNDLTQYTLAMDRGNSEISAFYNPYHPAVLELIAMTAKNAKAHGIDCALCGELAADLTMTETLLRMGITEFSVVPGAILELREKVRSINLLEQEASEQYLQIKNRTH